MQKFKPSKEIIDSLDLIAAEINACNNPENQDDFDYKFLERLKLSLDVKFRAEKLRKLKK